MTAANHARLLIRLVSVLVLAGAWAGCDRAATPTPSAQPAGQGIESRTRSALTPVSEDVYRRAREDMVASQIEARGVTDPAVLAALRSVPRHRFVPSTYLDQAYDDHPLPIGYGQTISQPYIVAAMTEVLHLRRSSKVLEIGTGSGYQAAVLAALTEDVYTVEIVQELCMEAQERLRQLGLVPPVRVACSDGYYGWSEHAPYDAIIVTAAPDHIPQPLVNQLVDGGRMVIPVGPPGAYQVLWLVERHGAQTTTERLMGVSFVPLTGGH